MLVTDSQTCMVDTARFFIDFSAREACGKAVPCRIGTLRLREALGSGDGIEFVDLGQPRGLGPAEQLVSGHVHDDAVGQPPPFGGEPRHGAELRLYLF